MKKTYVKPNLRIYDLQPYMICAGSFGDENGNNATGGDCLGDANDGVQQLSREDFNIWDD